MTQRTLDLNQHETTVLGVITRHQPISAELIGHYTELNYRVVDHAIERLIQLGVINLGIGGSPKRYKLAYGSRKDDDLKDDNVY